MAEYTRDDMEAMYMAGCRAGIVAHHLALIDKGETDGLLLLSLKERAKHVINADHDAGFEMALELWAEEKALHAKAGK